MILLAQKKEKKRQSKSIITSWDEDKYKKGVQYFFSFFWARKENLNFFFYFSCFFLPIFHFLFLYLILCVVVSRCSFFVCFTLCFYITFFGSSHERLKGATFWCYFSCSSYNKSLPPKRHRKTTAIVSNAHVCVRVWVYVCVCCMRTGFNRYWKWTEIFIFEDERSNLGIWWS